MAQETSDRGLDGAIEEAAKTFRLKEQPLRAAVYEELNTLVAKALAKEVYDAKRENRAVEVESFTWGAST